MNGLAVRRYDAADRDAWDALVGSSPLGTVVHRRGFLDVAGRGLEDHSLVVTRRGRPVAVLPAAVHPSDPRMVDSHSATSFGGLVHDPALALPDLVAALTAVAEHCFHDGFDTLRYKAVPLVYQAVPVQGDLYALHRLGATRSRCELASVVDLGRPRTPARHRLRHLRRARRASLQVRWGIEHLPDFWQVLVARLEERHGATPAQTLDDVLALHRAFPDLVDCVVARSGADVVAGGVVVRTGPVDHTPYLAADDTGYRLSALDLVIEDVVAAARRRAASYVSLGTTTTHGGRVLNEGLHRYKAEFGAGDVVHETYDLPLG